MPQRKHHTNDSHHLHHISLHNLRQKYYFSFLLLWIGSWGLPSNKAHAECEDFSAASLIGQLPPEVEESSGLAASRKNAGVWWTHNDSGGVSALFAIDSQGKLLGQFEVTGATNRDWEDIAVAPCPNGESCLYIGEIGDNGKRYAEIKVYRVPEPKVETNSTQNGKTVPVEVFTLTYPNGPRNAEALLIHPITRDIIIVTKEFAERCEIYTLSGNTPPGAATLTRVGDLDNLGDLVTGGDISPDGKIVALRFYTKAALYKVGPDGIPSDTNRLKILTMPQTKQAEAIAFSADGRTLLSTSEGQGKDATIYQQTCTTSLPEPTEEIVAESTKEPIQHSENTTQEVGDEKNTIETTVDGAINEPSTETILDRTNESDNKTGCSGCNNQAPALLHWFFFLLLLPLYQQQKKKRA